MLEKGWHTQEAAARDNSMKDCPRNQKLWGATFYGTIKEIHCYPRGEVCQTEGMPLEPQESLCGLR